VSHFDRTTPTLDESEKPRTVGSRLADIGDRLARTFTATERPSFYLSPEPTGDDFPMPGEREQPWERIAARFPVAREGYDRAAVDEHVSELEQELAEVERQLAQVRHTGSTNTAVAEEIGRIGEQTSAILMAAHQQAQEITRRSKMQADRCVAEAATRATAMTQEAEQRLRTLDADTDSIWSERAQLIDDVRGLAGALTKLAEESMQRFPPAEAAEPEQRFGPQHAAPAEPEEPDVPIVPVAETPTISISRLGESEATAPHQFDPEDG
jgi:cell division septum initiation protein DivIVA